MVGACHFQSFCVMVQICSICIWTRPAARYGLHFVTVLVVLFSGDFLIGLVGYNTQLSVCCVHWIKVRAWSSILSCLSVFLFNMCLSVCIESGCRLHRLLDQLSFCVVVQSMCLSVCIECAGFVGYLVVILCSFSKHVSVCVYTLNQGAGVINYLISCQFVLWFKTCVCLCALN